MHWTIALGLGVLMIFICVGLLVWYLIENEREETKRWAETQETERKEREADLEMARLGYEQRRILLEDKPTGAFPYTERKQTYGKAWVKPNMAENAAKNDAFKDLFNRMCKAYSIELGKDTWDEAEAKINQREQDIRRLHRQAQDRKESEGA